jgi:hypothetical protein
MATPDATPIEPTVKRMRLADMPPGNPVSLDIETEAPAGMSAKENCSAERHMPLRA